MKKIKITFEENHKNKYKKYPRMNLDSLASADDETAEQIQIDYIKSIKKKVLKRYLLPTAIISVLLICGCATLSLYLNFQNLEISSQHTITSERAEELAKEVRELKSGEKEDFKKNAQLMRDELIRQGYTPKSVPSEQEDKSKESRKNETSSIQNNEYNNQQTNNFNNARLCDVPDCNYRANRGSYYCSLHECSKAGCHNQRANDLSLYCIDHKCIVTDCNNGRSLNGFYCLMHSE